MTIQLPHRIAAVELRPARDRPTRWLTPTAGLWVATSDGEHAGMVERVDGVYHAKDGRGRTLGWFPDLDVALASVDDGEKARGQVRRGMRAALWTVNAVGAVTATALAIALLR